jgi:hypothetical protein
MKSASDPVAQRAALRMLAQGRGTPGEIARLAGISRQLIEGWARHAKLDWRGIRNERLLRAWSKEIERGFAIQRQARRRQSRMCAEGCSGPSRCPDEKALADPVRASAQGGGMDDKE